MLYCNLFGLYETDQGVCFVMFLIVLCFVMIKVHMCSPYEILTLL